MGRVWVFLVLAASCAGAFGAPGQSLAGKVVFDGEGFSTTGRYALENRTGFGLDAGAAYSGELLSGSLAVHAGNSGFHAMVGKGSLGNGEALKAKPYGAILSNSPRSFVQTGSTSPDKLIVSFGTPDVLFFASADDVVEGQTQTAGSSLSGLHTVLRLAGLEYALRAGNWAGAAALCASDIPSRPDSGGWHPSDRSIVEETALTAAMTGRIQFRFFEFGIWTAANAGYFETPGFSASAELAVKNGVSGAGGDPRRFSCAAKAFAFVASPGFRTFEGASPSYDCLVRISAAMKYGNVSCDLNTAGYSFSGMPAGSRLLNPATPCLDRALYRWRPDLVKAGLDLRAPGIDAGVDLSADRAGAKDASILLRYGRKARGSFLSEMKIGAKATFKRAGEGSDDEEPPDDDTETTDSDEEEIPETGLSGSDSPLKPRSAGMLLDMRWNLFLGKTGPSGGGVSLSVVDKNLNESLRLTASGLVWQNLAIGKAYAVLLKIKTPTGGYDLNGSSWASPVATVEFTIKK